MFVECLSYCLQSCILATSTSKWSVTYSSLQAEYFYRYWQCCEYYRY